MPASPTEVRHQLDRLLASPLFAHAERLRRLLRYVVEETLAGRGPALKEYPIGLAVCGRPSSFDPKLDPIVRVDANRLRARLKDYYEQHPADPLIIEVPKGAYAASFSAKAAPPSPEPLLAVLPFVSLLGDDADSSFPDSLTESLIHCLSRVPRLRVIARGSAFRYQHRGLAARDAGRELAATHVLEGSVRLRESHLRVTAQLVEVASGLLLWSQRFERPWRAIFSLEDEIAASLTDALAGVLGAAPPSAVFVHATENPDAYAHYLRGRYHWNQRTPASLERSLQDYENALAEDPACAPAWAGIADSLMVMAVNDQLPPALARRRALAAADQSLALRPHSPEALVARASVRCALEWDWESGHRDFVEALRLQPGFSNAHYLCAILSLQPRGLWDEARHHFRQALTLDPVSPVLWRDFGLVEFMARDFAAAHAHWCEAEQLSPQFQGTLFWRARLALATGDLPHAAALLRTRLAAGSNSRLSATLAFVLARSGDPAPALALARELDGQLPLHLALVHLGLRRFDECFAHLEAARQSGTPALYQFAVDPLYDELRGDPRAAALLAAMGLSASPR